MLLTPSKEQEDIIQTISNSNHVACDAVAGSGKTTTVLLLAQSLPNKHIIQITYNAQLKEEVRNKAKKYCDNLEVHTYHSLAVKYYNPRAYNDQELQRIMCEDDLFPLRKSPKVDILVIDEVQDMTPLFFRFLQKFISDLKNPAIIFLFLGDQKQCIYEFKDADQRFLTLAEKIWKRPEMVRKRLQTSYRLTNQIAWFVNNVMLDKPYIVANKNGPSVKYIKDNLENITSFLLTEILHLLKNENFQPGDIFILAKSLKNQNGDYIQLENALVEKKIPCYVSSSDRKLSLKVIEGKVVFSTIHQAKGRERPVVIVYGFDDRFFYYGDKPSHICPQELYVAATRSSNRLYLIEHAHHCPLPFLKYEQLSKYPEYIEYIIGNEEDIRPKRKIRPNMGDHENIVTYVRVTDIIKFLKDDAMNFCSSAVEQLFHTINEPCDKYMNIPGLVCCENGLYEEVCDLNGLAIPVMWYVKQDIADKKTKLHHAIEILSSEDTSLNDYLSQLKMPCVTIPDYLFLVNLYLAVMDKVHFKITQIESYDWLTDDMVLFCHQHMDQHVNKNIQYEVHIGCKNHQTNLNVKNFVKERLDTELGKTTFHFTGNLDAVDETIAWEFKCVKEITMEHKLQLVVYAWIWKMYMQQKCGDRIFQLMNIYSGEILRLNSSSPLNDEIICVLLHNKYSPKAMLCDEEFLTQCLDEIK